MKPDTHNVRLELRSQGHDDEVECSQEVAVRHSRPAPGHVDGGSSAGALSHFQGRPSSREEVALKRKTVRSEGEGGRAADLTAHMIVSMRGHVEDRGIGLEDVLRPVSMVDVLQ